MVHPSGTQAGMYALGRYCCKSRLQRNRPLDLSGEPRSEALALTADG